MSKYLDLMNKMQSRNQFEPLSPEVLQSITRNHHFADYQHEIIMEAIKDFESTLDDDHEVAIKLASFGQTVVMHVTDIGYSNPSLIHFYGYVNNQKSELIQHVNQLSFLLTSAKKLKEDRPARRIGFSSEHSDPDG